MKMEEEVIRRAFGRLKEHRGEYDVKQRTMLRLEEQVST
jgi:hypothetical protein